MGYIFIADQDSLEILANPKGAMAADDRISVVVPRGLTPQIIETMRQFSHDHPGRPWRLEVNEQGHYRVEMSLTPHVSR